MNTSALPAMGATEWLMLLGLSVLWGSSFLFFALLAAELPTLTVALGRVGFAALALNLLLVTFLLPASALLLGALVLAEPVTPRAVAGMALIGAGLAAIDGRLLRIAGIGANN